MNIIIVGCGKVGYTLVEQLGGENHNITVIDTNEEKVNSITDDLDAMGIVGNGVSFQTLSEAGIDHADLLIAVTGSDEQNLLCCVIAKKAGHCKTIARVRNPIYNNEIAFLREELGLAMIINPELSSAAEIARIFQFPSAVKIDTFSKGRIELLHFRVTHDCLLNNYELIHIRTTLKCDVLVCMVTRGDQVLIPRGDFVFREGDVVAIVSTPPKANDFFKKIGIGAGNKDFAHANILRAMLLTDKTVEVETGKDGHDESSMWVMEANLDDCTGEALGYAMEVLLEAGARDVWYTPAYMKKNRPAYVLHVLTTAEKREELEQLVFSCTTTIGVRRYPVERTILPREVKEIQTRYGAAKVKICKRGGVDTCYPEYESVRAICRETGKRFMEVFHGVMEDGSISLQ